MTADWNAALGEHWANDGFVEGPNNANPWGAEQGSPNAPYCASASCMVAYHAGVRFPAGSQFGAKGWAYCPYIVNDGDALGITEYDHASRGEPASMVPGDFAMIDWAGDGVADHVETIIATYADGTYDCAGYNTGSPEGCHVPIRRNRSYLLAVVHVRAAFYDAAGPGPTPPPAGDAPPWPGTLLVDYTAGHGTATWQAQMSARGWHLDVDDEYGPASAQVCTQFQAEKGLAVDGVVGPETWAAAWTAPIT